MMNITAALVINFCVRSPSQEEETISVNMGATQSSSYGTTSGPDKENHMESWMSSLADDVHISTLSLPGRHNSTALYGGDSVQCQSWKVTEQLKGGIRFLDTYCYHSCDAIWAYGGGAGGYDYKLDDVLMELSAFLDSHKKEFVLFRIRTESSYYDPNNAFRDEFRKIISRNGSKIFSLNLTKVPTVGEIRGHIVVIHNTTYIEYGMNEAELQVHYSDEWHVATVFDRWKKWMHVKAHLELAKTGDRGRIYVTYCSDSASMGAYPYSVASYVNYYCKQYVDSLDK